MSRYVFCSTVFFCAEYAVFLYRRIMRERERERYRRGRTVGPRDYVCVCVCLNVIMCVFCVYIFGRGGGGVCLPPSAIRGRVHQCVSVRGCVCVCLVVSP